MRLVSGDNRNQITLLMFVALRRYRFPNVFSLKENFGTVYETGRKPSRFSIDWHIGCRLNRTLKTVSDNLFGQEFCDFSPVIPDFGKDLFGVFPLLG